jgi:hypothetical protein
MARDRPGHFSELDHPPRHFSELDHPPGHFSELDHPPAVNSDSTPNKGREAELERRGSPSSGI